MASFNIILTLICAVAHESYSRSIHAALDNKLDTYFGENEINDLIAPCDGDILCENVAINERIQSDPDFAQHFTINDVTDYESLGLDSTTFRITSQHASASTCPVFNAAYFARVEQEVPVEYHNRFLSLSPWEWELNYDLTRYPPLLAQTRCLCQGCINGESEDNNFISQPMTADRYVKYIAADGSRSDGVATLNFGCRCQFPQRNNN